MFCLTTNCTEFTQTDNNNVELRRRAEANAAIAFISTAAGTGHRDVRNVVSDLENPKSYTNETFVIEYAGTDGAGEHVYFEIDEITPERRGQCCSESISFLAII